MTLFCAGQLAWELGVWLHQFVRRIGLIAKLDLERTQSLVRAAISHKADAAISTGPVDDATNAMICRSDTLLIQLWELPEKPEGVAIAFSHEDTGRDIAHFLVSRRYRNPYLVISDGLWARMRRDCLGRCARQLPALTWMARASPAKLWLQYAANPKARLAMTSGALTSASASLHVKAHRQDY